MVVEITSSTLGGLKVDYLSKSEGRVYPTSVAYKVGQLSQKKMNCKYIKADGEQCRANAMKNSDYCFAHNPDTQTERHLAVVKGGLNSRRVALYLEPLSIRTPQEIGLLLEDTINRVRGGEIPSNIANSIGFLAGHALRALEASDLDQRIEIVESVLSLRRRR